MPLYSFITAVFFLIVALPCAAVESSRPFSVSWTLINSGTDRILSAVHFAGPGAGWAVGEGGTILATRDGGATWTPQASGTDQALWAVHRGQGQEPRPLRRHQSQALVPRARPGGGLTMCCIVSRRRMGERDLARRRHCTD